MLIFVKKIFKFRVEEQLLRDFFGEEYVEYSKKTPILIPGIESRLLKDE